MRFAPEEASLNMGSFDSFNFALFPMLERFTETFEAQGGQATLTKLTSTVPLACVGRANEVAEVVAFKCTASSSYTHVALVNVSGGR